MHRAPEEGLLNTRKIRADAGGGDDKLLKIKKLYIKKVTSRPAEVSQNATRRMSRGWRPNVEYGNKWWFHKELSENSRGKTGDMWQYAT